MSLLTKSADAPRTPRKAGGHDAVATFIQKLRDDVDLGLQITPRDLTYSPSQHQNTLSDTLYNNIKFLYWKDPNALQAVISECKSDFSGSLKHLSLSAQRRTEYVSHKVEDALWIVKNRIQEPRPHPSTPPTGQTPPHSYHWLRSSHNPGGRIDAVTPSLPTSSLARKNMADADLPTPTTTRQSSRSGGDSFLSKTTTAATSFASSAKGNDGDDGSYGSSWRPSQDPFTELRRNLPEGRDLPSNNPILDTRSERSTTKRGRTDDTEGSPESPIMKVRKQIQEKEQDREQDIVSPSRPAKPHWQLKNLAKDGLGNESVTNPDNFWNEILTQTKSTTSTCILSGAITLSNKNKGPLVQTELLPVRWDNKSSRVQRHFGADRFLVLTAPSFTENSPPHIGGIDQDEHRRTAFNDWLIAPKHFLGRVWHIFQVEDIDRDKIKRKKKSGRIDEIRPPVRHISLFATEGSGISQKISIFEFLDWMFPFKENAKQPVCKSYARLQLSTKHSTPSIKFKPSQIRRVNDICANGQPESIEFEDLTFLDAQQKHWNRKEVMTDGCATISVGAALRIREAGAICDWPSAIQGRINGAKGMWCISAPYETSDPDHLAVWIEIRDSQLKIHPRKDDWDDLRCEEDRWTFDVKGYSRRPRISHLHRDFFPVLADRHVSPDVLLRFARESIELPIAQLRETMDDPAKLVFWCRTHGAYRSFEGPGLPRDSSQRVSFLVEQAGYMPRDNPIVAEAIERIVETDFQQIRRQFRFSCLRSASFLGLPDHRKVLKPGEVHLVLSQPLEDEATNDQFFMFAGNNVLVARDPTIRGSDMQKVRCICHPDLAHLKDVVIFPTRGKIPLAAKLQGGDYDGDRFWVCADQRLVEPFLNAPVLEQKGIGFFDIEQEKRTIEEIVRPEDFGTDKHAKAFLKIVLPIACREKPLGVVTNYCNDLSYARHQGRGLWDRDFTMLADLHDLIIDAEKNGYLFDLKDFAKCLKKHRLPKNLERREYVVNIRAAELRSDPDRGEKPGLLAILAMRPQQTPGHILDRVLFEEVNPAFSAYLTELQSVVLKPAKDLICDPDLEFCLRRIESDPELRRFVGYDAETRALEEHLQEALRKWTLVWLNEPRTNDDMLLQCIEYYNNIGPANPRNLYWKMPTGGSSDASNWDRFKIGVFSRKHYGLKSKAIFSIGRDTACKMKSQSESGMRNLNRIRENMKPQRPGEWKGATTSHALFIALGGDSESEDGFDDDLFDFGDVME